MAAIRLLAASSYAAPANDPPADLKPLLREVHPNRMRRNNRFTELALLGALRCVEDIGQLPEQCALYLASGQGNVTDTVSILHEVVRDRLEPMPLSFINVSSNIAGFTVSQVLGLHGRNLAVSRNGGAFDSALELALMDLQNGSVPMALVGVVEEYTLPLNEHRQRLGRKQGEVLAEQSSWLLLGKDAGPEGMGMLVDCRRYTDLAKLPEFTETHWITGTQLSASSASQLGLLPSSERNLPGYSESISIHHLVDALARQEPVDKALRYLNGDGMDGLLLFEFIPDHRK